VKINFANLLKPSTVSNPKPKFFTVQQPQFQKQILKFDLSKIDSSSAKEKSNMEAWNKNLVNSKFSVVGSEFSELISETSTKSNKQFIDKRSESSDKLKNYIGLLIRKKGLRKSVSNKELKTINLPSLPFSAKSSFNGNILKPDLEKIENKKNNNPLQMALSRLLSDNSEKRKNNKDSFNISKSSSFISSNLVITQQYD